MLKTPQPEQPENRLLNPETQHLLSTGLGLSETASEQLVEIVSSYCGTYRNADTYLSFMATPGVTHLKEGQIVINGAFDSPKKHGGECFDVSLHLARDLSMKLPPLLDGPEVEILLASGNTPSPSIFSSTNHVFLILRKPDSTETSQCVTVIDGSFQLIESLADSGYTISRTFELCTLSGGNNSALPGIPAELNIKIMHSSLIYSHTTISRNSRDLDLKVIGLTKDGQLGVGIGFGERRSFDYEKPAPEIFPILYVLGNGMEYMYLYKSIKGGTSYARTSNMQRLTESQQEEIDELFKIAMRIRP